MIVMRPSTFDIKQIADSGQCFRIVELEEGVYRAITKENYLEIKQVGNKLDISCDLDTLNRVWTPYFDLGGGYGNYVDRLVAMGGYLEEAARFSYGIRILRQDKFETLMSFIISQRNSIPRIKRTVEELCRAMGKEKIDKFTGKIFYTFPTVEEFEANKHHLDSLKLGYRTEYLKRAATEIARYGIEKFDSYESVLELRGVGPKVASCYCLYGLHQLDSFPIDVWMQRIIDEHFNGFIDNSKFKEFAGVAQQYMFYYERCKNGR